MFLSRSCLAAASLAVLATTLAGCATTAAPAIAGLPAVNVTATAETVPVGTANADAADDPAIWHNAGDPEASLIVATDKKAGLYVYGLDGTVKSFVEGGLLNNVDLASLPDDRVIVVASDRNDRAHSQLQIYQLNTGTGTLDLMGVVPGGAGEGYGLCLGVKDDGIHAYSVIKDGTIHEVKLGFDGKLTGTFERRMKVPTQAEGCVVDPSDGTLYVGEEDAGIWRFRPGESTGSIVAPVDNQQLVADVEGLAIWSGANARFLVASSQGDNAYAVFRLPEVTPVGRFRVGAGAFGATEETDGIEIASGNFGPNYPDGLFVAQDGHNAPHAQNFKLVSWKAIAEALGLK
ncbi:phytase [Altererythrobacter xixiisoli]|uniref:Phytase n=1 Tax=Croceibacterium xixiisoli TaxID=1476466 RepID=A0A6I4TPN9_9SPHN|nr:phytase [Croceibacterium xixiisoli]MXO97862.1 phytase [Croceibacterium xixiisoli]